VPKSFGTPGGPRQPTLQATPLFPFGSGSSGTPTTFYAGSCPGNNPTVGGSGNPRMDVAQATVMVQPGVTSDAPVITLPKLNLTVWSGSRSSRRGLPVNNAHVVLDDDNCSDLTRTFFTNALGRLSDPGMPYSRYDVCADNGIRRVTQSNVNVKTVGGANVNLYLTSGSSRFGTCPS
jgi:hypothetical protein